MLPGCLGSPRSPGSVASPLRIRQLLPSAFGRVEGERGEHVERKRSGVVIAVLAAWSLFTGLFASPMLAGASGLSPTSAQLAAEVASGLHQQALTAAEAAQLLGAPGDFSWSNYPTLESKDTGSTCSTTFHCVYGDVTSSKVVVLFGDSHALMWLPALAPLAAADHERLVVLWLGLCPAAQVSVYFADVDDPYVCNTWRSAMERLIVGLHPSLVLLADKSSDEPSANGSHVTASVWQRGMGATIAALRTPTTKVAVLGDAPTFAKSVPVCLSMHPTSLQRCTVRFDDPATRGLSGAEAAAAGAGGARYINTESWFCAHDQCPAIIGGTIAYVDSNHVSFAYAQQLSGALGTALAGLMGPS